MAFQAKDPTQATIDANEAAQSKYAMDDRDDFHDVDRGFIVGIGQTLSDAGDVVFDKTHTDYITPVVRLRRSTSDRRQGRRRRRPDHISVVDKDEQWTMWAANGVMNARPTHAADVQLTVSGPKAALVGLLLAPAKAAQLLGSGALTTDGDTGALDTLAAVMDEFDPAFNLVTP